MFTYIMVTIRQQVQSHVHVTSINSRQIEYINIIVEVCQSIKYN